MRSLVRRLNFRDQVLRDLDALLLFYPRKRQFVRDFPDLKAKIGALLEQGVAAPAAALQISVGLIGNFVGQLDERERAATVEALVATRASGFSEIAQRRVAGTRDETKGRVDFVTRLAGVAIFIAGRMTEEGALRADEYDWFLSELERMLIATPSSSTSGESAEHPLALAFALPAQRW